MSFQLVNHDICESNAPGLSHFLRKLFIPHGAENLVSLGIEVVSP